LVSDKKVIPIEKPPSRGLSISKMIRGQSTTTIYPVGNYSFGTKPAKIEKDTAVAQRMERLKEKYVKEGVRKSVDAVLLVYEHGHPHVLLLQVGTSFFKLPGGRLRPGEGGELVHSII
jgi:cleavage and polyadenylation specificity factor subunit 5